MLKSKTVKKEIKVDPFMPIKKENRSRLDMKLFSV